MSISKNLLRLSGIAGVAGLAVWGLATGREGSSFDVQPGSPSAKAAVRFVDRTAGANAWRWDFGDGSGSGEQSPAHVYAQAGTYPVTLMVNGMATSAREVQVVNSTTLRLMSNTGNPFDITLHARDPRTGNEGEGEAIPQNDVFGYFTIPSLVPISPGAPFVPEVFVKMLDARAIQGQDFWLFWGGLTDLEFTLTVTDTVRGTFKTKTNPARPPGQGTNDCLGADTGGFAGAGVTPAPSPTPTPPAGGIRVVNVGQAGNSFTDSQSGNRTTTVRVGDTVQWNWAAGTHSSTSGECRDSGGQYGGYDCDNDGIWSSGEHSSPYQYSRTFTAPGNYKYHCDVHGYAMTGTVVVTAQ